MTDAELEAAGYYFDEQAAAFAIDFVELCCVHVEGDLAGQPFLLLPWQRKIVSELFGWKRPDGRRRFRTAYLSTPRKNGKSTLGSAIALYLLVADGELGAKVFSAAGDREQAKLVWKAAKTCVLTSPALSEQVRVFRDVLEFAGTCAYKAISADAYRHHGLNASGVVFDELHVMKTRELWDVLVTSTGSRSQPLVVGLTTAGQGTESLCRELYDYARQVRDGVVDDPTFYVAIFEAAPDDDWTHPEVWRKANPSIGHAVTEDYLAKECARAQIVPAYQNEFRRLHLNQWTAANERAIDLRRWDEGAEPFDLAELEGIPCYGGLDLASTRDLSAFVLVWPRDGAYFVRPWFWLPEAWKELQLRRQVPYDAWVRDGLIETTPGDVIDQEIILQRMLELVARFDVVEIGFDRYHAEYLESRLAGEVRVVGVGQGYLGMSNGTSELLALYSQRRIRHGGNAVLRWMADNTEVRRDPAGNLKPDRSNPRQKIDGIVALIMALDRCLRLEGSGGSVYDTRGIITL